MVLQNLEDLITALFDCVCSLPGCDAVKNEVSDSVKSLAKSQPTTLLTSAHAFLLKNTKLSASSRSFVMRSIEAVAEDEKSLSTVDEQLLLLIINLTTQEMTMAKDADSEWADSARDVLVRIASSERCVHFVLDALLQKFPPGLTPGPHRYVVLTLGAVAQHNPHGFVPFLTDVLSRAVPVLPHIKTESARCAWTRAMCAFCEAVRECETVQGPQPNPLERGEAAENGIESEGRVSRTTYSDQAEAAYEVIFPWMSAKDARVRAEAAECIGELSTMIPKTKVVEDIRKLVTTMLSVYRKALPDQFHFITQGVCRLLEATCCDDCAPLDAYLDELLNALFPHACLDADDTSSTPNPLAIKNHSEALRCFHVGASRFADRIVYYLLHKMQNVQDLQKLSAINLLRYLLNSSGVHMDDKRQLVMMGLRKLLTQDNSTASLRVCRSIVQLCVALADHAYIDADGGEHVIAFLVRNLVVSADIDSSGTRRIDGDVASLNQLRTQCAQALHTISATCDSAQKLLWPYLFEFVCMEKYTPVVADICKCLRTLIARDLEHDRQPDFVTGFENPRVAGRHAVFARLLGCLCNAPLNGGLARRSRECLGLLRGIATWLHPAAAETIMQRTAQLETALDEVTGTTSYLSPLGEGSAPERRAARVARWHELVLAGVEAMMAAVPEGEWRMEVAAAMAKQLDLYSHSPDDKAFLLRCLGVVLSKITLNNFVVDHMILMFRSTNHGCAPERVGCARAVGAVAKVHCDLVLVQLENIAKWEHTKKTSGLFAWVKDAMPMRQYTDVEMVHLRATLMLSYGYLVQACPPDALPQRLQQTIIVFLRHYMANQKQETVVRECLLETIHLISLALHPTRLGTDYTFEQRNELIAYIKDYVQSESADTLSSAIRLLACKAAAALVRLEPPLSESEMWDLGGVLTAAVLPISREKSGLKTLMAELDLLLPSVSLFTSSTALSISSSAPSSRHPKRMEDEESATTMDATVAQYNSCLVALVQTSPTVDTVTLLLKMLLPYYGRLAEHERARSVDATLLILKTYFDHAMDIKLGTASDFGPLSSLLARLTPRLVDSLCSVRLQSLNALYQALRLAHAHKGHGLEAEPRLLDCEGFAAEFLSEEGKLDGQSAKRAVKRFAEIIESRLPQSHVQTYLSALFEMLGDRQSQVSAAAAQLLTHMLTERGSSLHAEAETLACTLLARLSEVHSSCVQTYSDVLAALVAFSAHQQVIVVDVLLRQPLPYSLQATDAWECICRERSLFPALLEYVLELTVASLENPHELIEIGGGSSVKVALPEVCAYAAALQEVIKAGDMEANWTERVPAILLALLQLLFSVADTQFPVMVKAEGSGGKAANVVTPELRRAAEKPAGLVTGALRTLLARTRQDTVNDEMNSARAWTDCQDKQNHATAVGTLVRSLCEHRPEWVQPLVRGAMKNADSEREALRAAAATICTAAISRSPAADGSFDEVLFDDCVLSLQKALKDSSLRIRKLSVRGMGELADCRAGERAAAKYANVSVDAAMAGLDDVGDRKDEVATESICALNKLVGGASNEQLRAILPPLLLKVRPCFDKESAFLRAAAFRLFGEMAARVGEDSQEFPEHVHTNVVAILLHMHEDDEGVRKACGRTLQQASSLLPTELAANVVKAHVAADGRCSNLSLLSREFSAVLTCAFPDRVNAYALATSNYFKSAQPRVRAAAAELTGHLLGSLAPPLKATISKQLIFSGLVLLLRDPEDVSVRVSTARAIANLHAYV